MGISILDLSSETANKGHIRAYGDGVLCDVGNRSARNWPNTHQLIVHKPRKEQHIGTPWVQG